MIFYDISPDWTVYLTLLFLAALALLGVWRWRWRDFNLPAKVLRSNHKETLQETETERNDVPKVSVIIPVREEVDLLSLHLPLYLSQDYPDFEVIVTDEGRSADVCSVIERLKAEYPNLRYSFVPQSSRCLDKKKMAYTLGVKASYAEWVLLTEINMHPADDQWLTAMMQQVESGVLMVKGYTSYEENADNYSSRAVFERFFAQTQALRALKNGRALNAGGANLLLKKSFFMEKKGFANSLTLPFGEIDLFMAAHGDSVNTRWALETKAHLKEMMPSQKILSNERMHHAETQRWLPAFACCLRNRDRAASMATYLGVCCMLVYFILRMQMLARQLSWTPLFIILDAAWMVILLSGFLLPLCLLSRAARLLHESKMSAAFLLFSIFRPWRNIQIKRERRKHRREFVRQIL